MMEQLDFRVYDHEGIDPFKPGHVGCFIENSKDISHWHLDSSGYVVLSKYDEGDEVDYRVDYNKGRFDILLWTGEKDVKGIKMYDGHIVKRTSKDHDDGEFYNGIIRHKNGAFAVYALDKKDHHLDFIGPDSYMIHEVIGHKHPNPELMLKEGE